MSGARIEGDMDVDVVTKVVEKLDELDAGLCPARTLTIVFTSLKISVILPMKFSCFDRKFGFHYSSFTKI
jgi:hypothetical protein